MNKRTHFLIAALLAGTGIGATAAAADTTAFADNDAGTVLLAQREAISEYNDYIDQKMDMPTMRMLDANNDGEVSQSEFRDFYKEVFGTMDKNHDGMISGDEMPKSDKSSNSMQSEG